jgi:Phage integrase family.
VEYLNNALPNDCPYLFPHLTGDIESIHDFAGMKRSKWSIMGNPRKHFSWLLKRAGIEDFHFHDLKRMATTFMIENGYSADDLLDLGMYATRDMIDRCYKKRDALQVLRRISVAPEVAFRANDSSIAL